MKAENQSVVGVFGLPVDNVTMSEAVDRIKGFIQSGETHQVATANLDFVRNARNNQELQRVICDCSLVVADGSPLLWAARLLGHPLKERVTGADLVPHLAKLSADTGYGIYLLGSSDTNAQLAMDKLRVQYPGVNFVGHYAPPIAPLSEMDDDAILQRIHAAKPQILLVAMGNPKQELWLARNRGRLNVPVSIGIGGTLEMIAGTVKRAPMWIQKIQMEWVFRMMQEPQRLLPRYARDLKALLQYLPGEVVLSKIQPKPEQLCGFEVKEGESLCIVSTPAAMTGYACSWMSRQMEILADQKRTVIVDMNGTSRMEADGLGCMLRIRHMMASKGLSMRMMGVTAPVYRMMQNAALTPMFQMTLASTGTSAAIAAAASKQAILQGKAVIE